MTIVRVYPPAWAVGEKLTSAQQNALDINTTYAYDIRAGEVATIESVGTLTGAGRIITPLTTGANADTTYLVSGGNLAIRVTSAVTANRVYTLSNTDAAEGDELIIYAELSFVTYTVTVQNAALATIYIIGNTEAGDGPWAHFVFSGGEWRVWKSPSGTRLRKEEFTVPGTWICPLNVTSVQLIGVGAGGGGGGGYTAAAGGGGGSGGGGSLAGLCTVTVVPGVSYTVTPGVGGAGGAAASDGADGGDSTFGALATFYGAGRGGGGRAAGSATYGAGGKPTRAGVAPDAHTQTPPVPMPGQGGVNAWSGSGLATAYRNGGYSAVAVGGAAAADGGGECGGSGGGASGYLGNVAGAGGAPSVVGTAGTLGAGGGGGGSTNGFGAAGGAGGNGAIIVAWVK